MNRPTLGKWTLTKQIACGSTCRVYQGFDNDTKQNAAIKIFEYSPEITAEYIQSEKEISQGIEHPNVLSYVDFFDDVDFEDCRGSSFKISALVTELAPNGDLLNLVENHGKLPEILARTYFHQLIDGLDYLHEKKIAHRDIKPENILLDKNFCLKIADFGHSLDLSKSATYGEKVGTSLYFAPEIHQGGAFDVKEADLFAAAIVLFCMITGNLPFTEAKASNRLYRYFTSGNTKDFWDFHQRALGESEQIFNEDLQDLLEKLLDPNPSNRLFISKIRDHAWYNKEIIEDDSLTQYLKQLSEPADM